MFNFSSNHKTINEIHKMYGNGTLIIDNTYQRRSVWSEKDKIRLIETILQILENHCSLIGSSSKISFSLINPLKIELVILW